MVREKELTCQRALENVLKAEFPQCEYAVGGYKEDAICLQQENGEWGVYNGYRNTHDNLSLHANIVDAWYNSAHSIYRKVPLGPFLLW